MRISNVMGKSSQYRGYDMNDAHARRDPINLVTLRLGLGGRIFWASSAGIRWTVLNDVSRKAT